MNISTRLLKQIILSTLLIYNFYYTWGQVNERVNLAYFPSWSETWTSTNQNSKLREVPEFVNYVFLAFAKPNLEYVAGSYDITQTGIEVPYDGCTLKESVSALKDKGIKVILSVGGETYWGSPNAYNIDYQQIKDLVDDIGFSGIDWDFEPNGSFTNIGSQENVQHFINFFNQSRAIMPSDEGYILACAPSGVGALGGQSNDDTNSPFSFQNRNILTGETDANLYNGTASTNGINLFGFSATGHMIPVIESVGDKIDLIAFQGYNVGGSTNRSIMYDAYAYYAEQYDFLIAAGVHFPNEPWGPYYEYTLQDVAELSEHIRQHSTRSDNNDGIMIWQLLLQDLNTNDSGYEYMNVSSAVLQGDSVSEAINNSDVFNLSPYSGGSEGCDQNSGNLYCGVQEYNVSNSYPTPNTQVHYNCKIWENQWWVNPNEIPGENLAWVEVNTCDEADGCNALVLNVVEEELLAFYPNPISESLNIKGLNKSTNYTIYDAHGKIILQGYIENNKPINLKSIKIDGLFFIKLDNFNKIFKLFKN